MILRKREKSVNNSVLKQFFRAEQSPTFGKPQTVVHVHVAGFHLLVKITLLIYICVTIFLI